MVSIVAVVLYFSYYHFKIITIRNSYLIDNSAEFGHYLWHYAITVFLLAIVYIGNKCFYSFHQTRPWVCVTGLVFATFTLTSVLSVELDHVFVILNYKPGILPAHLVVEAYKLPYTILWAVVAFALMVTGMWRKNKQVRVVALLLLFTAVVKLFAYDVLRIDESSQVIAFIVIGLILLLMSFLYQRLKNILF